MRPKWAFQLLPHTPGVLGKGFRVDAVTQAIEDEVNAVLQRKFGFHGISKLVIRLGPGVETREYHEHIGVAQKVHLDFDIHAYQQLGSEEKREFMRGIILEVFDWLISRFDDAQCFKKAIQDLGWTGGEKSQTV